MGFEIGFSESIYSLIGQSAAFDFLIKAFAQYLPYAFLGGAIWFFLRHSWRESIYGFCFATLTAIVSRGIITEIIRAIYPRLRPFEALNFEPLFIDTHQSFPSGHTAFFFAIAFSIFLFNKKIGWLFISLAFLNGVARVFAGVHWPLDILGGISAALVSFWLIYKLVGKYRKFSINNK